jgi:hypothetical protein
MGAYTCAKASRWYVYRRPSSHHSCVRPTILTQVDTMSGMPLLVIQCRRFDVANSEITMGSAGEARTGEKAIDLMCHPEALAFNAEAEEPS